MLRSYICSVSSETYVHCHIWPFPPPDANSMDKYYQVMLSLYSYITSYIASYTIHPQGGLHKSPSIPIYEVEHKYILNSHMNHECGE